MGPKLNDVFTLAVDKASRTYLIDTRHLKMAWPFYDPSNPRIIGNNFPYYPHRPDRQSKRRVFQAQSADLVNWSEAYPLVVPDDDLDNIDDAFYGMVQYDAGGLWIGFLNVFHMTDNTIDVQLVYSHDGRRFQRFLPGRPWLTTGKAGSWDQFMVNICSAPVEVGDDLYVYYGGAKNHHDWWLYKTEHMGPTPEADDMSRVGYCLGLAQMKRDRFVSMSAGSVRQGILVTRPINTAGGKLVINAQCNDGGHIEVQIADGSGNVLPGFERENCLPFDGDAVEQQVRWKQKTELPKGWLKIHFFLRDANLYTFRVQP